MKRRNLLLLSGGVISGTLLGNVASVQSRRSILKSNKNFRISSTISGVPVIAQWTRTGSPGDAIVLTGTGFSRISGFIASAVSGGQNFQCEIISMSSDSYIAVIKLPTGLPSEQIYRVVARNSSGNSFAVLINEPEIWWCNQSILHRSKTYSLHGRNLVTQSGVVKVTIYLQSGQTLYQCNIVANTSNSYKVDFVVPSQLANGRYTLTAKNLRNEVLPVKEDVITLNIADEIVHNLPVINVKNFGAVGNGVTDDSVAIRNALNTAKTGSRIYFPAGTYITSGYTNFPVFTCRIYGDGKDVSIIKGNFIGYSDGSIIENLCLARSPLNTFNYVLLTIRHTSRWVVRNVKFDSIEVGSLDVHDTDNTLVENCVFLGRNIFIGSCRHLIVKNNSFYEAMCIDAAVHGFGSNRVSIINNVVQHLKDSIASPATVGRGRILVDNDVWNTPSDYYISGNKSIRLAPLPNSGCDQNGGEQILWETARESYELNIVSATSNSITVSNFVTARDVRNFSIAILSGKGKGQVRNILSYDSNTKTYKVVPKWNITPDSSSKLSLSRTPRRLVVFNNSFEGRAHLEPGFYTASTGVQTYYGAEDLIVDSNQFNNLRNGVALWTGDSNCSAPSFFTFIANNKFNNIISAVFFLAYYSNRNAAETNYIGNIFRKNVVNKAQDFFKTQFFLTSARTVPVAECNVLQQNSLSLTRKVINLTGTNADVKNTVNI